MEADLRDVARRRAGVDGGSRGRGTRRAEAWRHEEEEPPGAQRARQVITKNRTIIHTYVKSAMIQAQKVRAAKAAGPRRLIPAITAALAALMFLSGDLFAQNDIRPLVQKLKYYRYSDIWVLRLQAPSVSTVKKLLTTSDEAEEVDPAILAKVDDATIRAIDAAVQRSRNFQDVVRQLQGLGIRLTPDIQAVIEAKIKDGGVKRRIEDVYLVTTRAPQGVTPTIISLIQSSKGKEKAEDNLNTVAPTDILTIDELKAYEIDSSLGAANLYDYVENAIVQRDYSNITAELQGLGQTNFYPQVFGKSAPLERNSANVSPEDIQQYLRISNGEPSDIYRENLLVVGVDEISYRRYEDPYYYPPQDDEGNDLSGEELEAAEADAYQPILNNYLPKYGVELKYGIDEINYPGLWSERVALNAIWSNVKLGVILPTSGWATLSEDLGADRMLTHGSFGINGKMDFPIKVIPKSGIFSASFGYVLGDAEPASYKDRDTDPFTFFEDPNDLDYFIRFNAQAHYTFAVAVDDDYLFRFGVGGTVYTIEDWRYELDQNSEFEDVVEFREQGNETRGGISGRIEFMGLAETTPFGFGVQYFDEAIWGNIWLQIPVSDQVRVKLDARGFAAALRDEHAWEPGSVFLPSVRVLYNW